MRIAILSRTQNTTMRGVESFALELSKRLARGNEVDILAGREADDFWHIIRGNYDIVMPLNGRLQSMKASFGRIFSGYKLVIGGHSGRGRDDILNIALAKPDVFVAFTDQMADWAKKWAWGTRVVKIPNGVDLEKFNPKGEKSDLKLKPPVVLSVGALVWYKHHEEAIEAVSKLEGVSLLIVGNGELFDELERLGKDKLGDRFKIVSAKYSEMPKIYRSCDVFTLPSWNREAFGLVYLEAMACGLPVVAPDDLSRKEIVGEGGILVDTGKAKEYAAAIKKALEINWGERPKRQAGKFSWEKVSREYEECFQKLLD